MVFWHFIYALEVGLGCQGTWGGASGWWQGVAPQAIAAILLASSLHRGQDQTSNTASWCPRLMELGKHLPDVCSCFLPLPIQSLGSETHVSCFSGGLWSPGFGLSRLAFPSPVRDHSLPLMETLTPSSLPPLPEDSFHALPTGKSFLLCSLHPSCWLRGYLLGLEEGGGGETLPGREEGKRCLG